MSTETPRQERWIVLGSRREPCDGQHRGFLAGVKVVAAAVGIVLMAEVADAFAHPTTLIPMLATVVVALGLVSWLMAAGWAAMASAGSRECHVFRARRVMRCGVFLAVVGVLLAAATVAGQPFEHLTTTFRIGAGDIADLALVIAAITCLSLAAAALIDVWGLWHEERRWAEQHEWAEHYPPD